MTKREFITELRERLQGEVSPEEAERSIRYYEQYFDDAARDGKTERQVAEELGSPLLIAKTIIDTQGPGYGPSGSYYEDGSPYEDGSSYGDGSPYEDGQESSGQGGFRHYQVSLTDWKVKAVLIAVVVLLILLLVTILRALVPLAVPIAVILILVHHFRGR